MGLCGRFVVYSAAVVFFAAVAWAAEGNAEAERDTSATQVAKAWFTSLSQGDTAVTTSLSAVPFSFDKKQDITTLSELKKRYDQIVAAKGKRDLKPTSVKIESSSAEKVEVIIMIEDEGIVIEVKPGEAFRVVGFWD